MMIEEAIYSHLTADTGLAALVPARIYPLAMPQDGALPALVYSKVSGVPEYSHDGNTGLVEARFQFSCLGQNYGQTKSLSRAVKRAMQPLERAPRTIGGAAGVRVASALLENEVDIYDANEVEHAERVHIPLDYLIQYYEEDL